jgi:hypothetical protein
MTVNARIASLEAELEASRKAWDVATAAKVAAEKFAKSVAAKAKKAEKALADADQGYVQREQAIIQRLNQILALAGGKYRAVFFSSICSFCYLQIFAHYLLFLSFCTFVENTGVSLVPLQPSDEDPLMAAVNLLE